MNTKYNQPNTPTLEDEFFIVPTQKYVKDLIQNHAQSRNHPYATLQDKGFVTLSNDVSSDSETNAATPKAVKIAYDLANTANQNASNANENANTRLSKDQNGADILDKAAFVKNLGLSELVYRTVGNGPNQIPDMNSFESKLSESGYQKLPGGLIIQWGIVNGGISNTDLRKFPIPFNNKCFVVTGNYVKGEQWGQGISVEIRSKEEFLIVIHDSRGNWSSSQVQYIAIGY
ncbi:gp53-like domain-containing protein [Xenorhabdus griffiniae]|uniref:Phage tail protein n=1 Tax=Xenorhabdus griffiniae TaxID=351672 RepID=A0ABY9XKF7_9GAMM|nr:phage tail protein [Xenorhabdus griffiniae]MBD1228220.1 tail fiber protein [Xenorhabdus griffiniae]MBE8588315.1 tail fiber protein [Xenorhabdus griffiniae]WMV73429.1 phage tail protein [Xenorhabdus griffiniae]WNH03108.1 phage tail protein [Xenorhabdus griffiniae]